ncbi:hypothetical protein ACV35P_35120, partial [Pseudomonas aeruginosa]
MPHHTLSGVQTITQWAQAPLLECVMDPKMTFRRKVQRNALQRNADDTSLFNASEVHILPPGKFQLTGGDDDQ